MSREVRQAEAVGHVAVCTFVAVLAGQGGWSLLLALLLLGLWIRISEK